MTESSAEPKLEKLAKGQFILAGFTQTAGIRIYAFECTVERQRFDYTVEVDLAKIPGYGIRIQDLPLLCRELLQAQMEMEEVSALVFTEQLMRTHADKLQVAREVADQKRKQPRHLAKANTGAAWRPGFR